MEGEFSRNFRTKKKLEVKQQMFPKKQDKEEKKWRQKLVYDGYF